MIIKNSKLVIKGFLGLTLYPFILLAPKAEKLSKDQYRVLINHEKIHLAQQKELLVIFFYIAYLLNYLINLVRYRSKFEAYINIVFEKEANKHERNDNYLETRKSFNYK